MRVRETRESRTLLEISLDYEKAEVPSRAYFADYAQVIEGRADITLLFGRLVPGSSDLRTQVEISFPRENFVAQLWRSSRDLHESLSKREGVIRLSAVEGLAYSTMVHTSRANNAFIALLGEESLLDFYYISPSDIHFVRAGRRKEVNLEAVIRISLPTPLLLEFLDQCDAMVQRMPDATRIMEREENES